ncbi:hypothetical protein ACQJBY_071557 [Aegilops geniculata]
MVYLNLDDGGSDEVLEEEGSHMSHHGHLRTVYMSGFRCYNDQVKLAYCISSTWKYSLRVTAGMFPISGHGAGILERHLSVSTSYVSAHLQAWSRFSNHS